MLLPREFWVDHGNPPWKGGVERALMSTTADKDVALHYANGKGTVVEIDVGRIQIGGNVAFLSMVRHLPYPSSRVEQRDATALAVSSYSSESESMCTGFLMIELFSWLRNGLKTH